jgi:hypothetical protein
MQKNLEIKPMVGFGDLKFGATTEAVEKYFGKPQETETLDVEGEINEIEVWSYWEMGHSVYFEKDQDNVCTNFETDNEQALLFGQKVFGLDEAGIVDLMKKQGFADFEVDEEEPGERILFFHDAHLQFVLEEGELVLVSWAVAVDEEDRILWP